MQPFHTVEKPGFKQMIKKLDPEYALPTRKYFSQTEIPMLYTQALYLIILHYIVVPRVYNNRGSASITMNSWLNI